MGLLDILKQYAEPGSTPSGDVLGHFDAVANQSNSTQLGGGIAAALRSNVTPPLGQVLGNLFGQSNPQQKAGVLNEIIQSLVPTAAASAGGGILGRLLGNVTGGSAPISPEQAEQVSPSALSTLATHAQQQDDSIVDRLGSFYAQHPTLVKTLGAAAVGAVMSHMSQQNA